MIQIKRKCEEKNERRPHVGNCAAGRQITPFHHRGFYSTLSPGHLLALTVHKDVSSLPSTPPGISWQLPIRRLQAIGSMLAEAMCTN